MRYRVGIAIWLYICCCLFQFSGIAAEVGMPPAWCQTAAEWWPTVHTATPLPATAAVQDRFAQLLRHTLTTAWLPDEALSYLPQWGFVFTRTSATYRLRAREVMSPVYDGAREMNDGLLLRIEPVTGSIPIPQTRQQMAALLQAWLSTEVLQLTDLPGYATAVFRVANGIAHYAQANNLYAWTDGKAITAVYYEEPVSQYPQDMPKFLPGVRNPWLQLAAQWPLASTLHNTPPPTGAAEHFALWTHGTILPGWLPASMRALVYDKTYGFLIEKSNAQYRVQIREVSLPATRPWNAILVAITPRNGAMPLPNTDQEMLAVLRKFLTSDIIAMPSLEQCPADFVRQAHACHFSRYHSESQLVTVPINLFAWCDGKRLLVALQQDVPSDCPTCTF